MQERYWKMLTNYKFTLLYLDEHFKRCILMDRIISIIIAVSSSSSIAGWAIWNKFSFIWALIIAISQVANMINNFLPYQKRIKDISDLKPQLIVLYNEIEHSWLSVADGTLSEKEINDLYYEYVRNWVKIDSQFFYTDSLPLKKQYIEIAQKSKNDYFKMNF